MRKTLVLALAGLAACVLLLPFNLAGCNPLQTGGGGLTSGSTIFNLPPTVNVSVVPDPPRGVAPFTVAFDSSDSIDDGVIVRREWDFADGTTVEGISPSHTFRSNGEFDVTLTLTDDDGARATRTVTVLVTDRPVAVINLDRDSAANAPATFNFDASASFDPDAEEGDVLRYRWTFGDGTSEILPIVPHTYATPGTYRVVLTVTDATGISGTAERIIEVGIPQPEISFASPSSNVENLVCSAESRLWVLANYDVTPGVPYTITAGLDEDTDPANDNDIQLGTRTNLGVPVFSDLDLSVPTALYLTDVPTGTYRLWAELDTDRTDPTRTYADANIHIVDDYTATIGGDTPTLPLLPAGDENWQVALPPTPNRQIFDIGPLNTGDRLYLALLTVPGYGASYQQDEYSLMILDAQEKLFAWYGSMFSRTMLGQLGFFDSPVYFSSNSKLVIGHNSQHYYVVLDAPPGQVVPGVDISIQRDFANDSLPRKQRVFLNWTGTNYDTIAVSGSPEFQLDAFALDPFDADVIAQNTLTRMNALFAPYNFEITSSNAGDTEPTEPHITVYFDGGSVLVNTVSANALRFYGLTGFIDPRNETLTGMAVIAADQMLADFPGTLTNEVAIGTALGNAAAHHVGLLCGLRETTGVAADLMTEDETQVTDGTLNFEIAPLAPLPGLSQIGIQDGPQLMQELFRP